MSESEKYLAVKNWDKFQSGKGKMRWIKVETDLEDDSDFKKLTMLQRGLLMSLWRLRGRTGKNLPNDSTDIACGLQVISTERPCLPHAISTLIARGFLIPTNQQDSSLDKIRLDKNRGEGAPATELPKQPPKPISAVPPRNIEPFNPIEGAKVLCDFEHLNLSGERNLKLAEEVVAKAILAWNVDVLEAVDRITENWRTYLKAPLEGKKSKLSANWWLSDGSWNVVILVAEKPLTLPERRQLEEIGQKVDFSKKPSEYRALLKGAANVH